MRRLNTHRVACPLVQEATRRAARERNLQRRRTRNVSSRGSGLARAVALAANPVPRRICSSRRETSSRSVGGAPRDRRGSTGDPHRPRLARSRALDTRPRCRWRSTACSRRRPSRSGLRVLSVSRVARHRQVRRGPAGRGRVAREYNGPMVVAGLGRRRRRRVFRQGGSGLRRLTTGGRTGGRIRSERLAWETVRAELRGLVRLEQPVVTCRREEAQCGKKRNRV